MRYTHNNVTLKHMSLVWTKPRKVARLLSFFSLILRAPCCTPTFTLNKLLYFLNVHTKKETIPLPYPYSLFMSMPRRIPLSTHVTPYVVWRESNHHTLRIGQSGTLEPTLDPITNTLSTLLSCLYLICWPSKIYKYATRLRLAFATIFKWTTSKSYLHLLAQP